MTKIKSLKIIQWKWQIDSGIRSDRQSAWRTIDSGLRHCTEEVIKSIPKKKKCKKAKWLSEEVLQIAVKRREAKSQGEKERYNHLNAEFQRIARRDKKAFLSSDFGTPQNKVSHCFHCFPIYLPWSDGTRCHDLNFLNVELQANVFTLLFHFHWEAL